jgi:hypothetical protein
VPGEGARERCTGRSPVHQKGMTDPSWPRTQVATRPVPLPRAATPVSRLPRPSPDGRRARSPTQLVAVVPNLPRRPRLRAVPPTSPCRGPLAPWTLSRRAGRPVPPLPRSPTTLPSAGRRSRRLRTARPPCARPAGRTTGWQVVRTAAPTAGRTTASPAVRTYDLTLGRSAVRTTASPALRKVAPRPARSAVPRPARRAGPRPGPTAGLRSVPRPVPTARPAGPPETAPRRHGPTWTDAPPPR